MDSRPVFCLPRGSIVSVLKSTVSENYDIMSRRVLVKHVSEQNGKVTEGWASVQSSQGYVILSPLLTLCYENTKWGNTRPIIRQCGHAAHLRCVELHTLSLHQRAAGEQPYDGRFAANIDDGEFLCPLCKQLSNILIPRDGCARDEDLDSKGGDAEMKASSEQQVEKMISRLVISGTTLNKADLESFSEIGQKALADFGAHLFQGMGVSWERTTGARKRKHRKWHPAIQRWDYEEEEEDISGRNVGVKSILRLLRQQHIAWAAIGHSAAAAEASVRGLEEVLPFGSFSKTEDPWPGYNKSKDSDPMLLELTRTITGVSGLLEVLLVRMAKELSGGEMSESGAVSVVGKCLSDILGGHGWFSCIQLNNEEKGNAELVLWSQMTALMASMPCHVAQDGMLSRRHEARAAAAAMWTVRGLGSESKAVGEPPIPLAVSKILAGSSKSPPEIRSGWGTMSPFTGVDNSKQVPFRPGVAGAFLYTPLLAWDLNTFAGAIFSSLLLNTTPNLPDSEDILNVGRFLIVGRLIQAMVTPYGFDSPSSMEVDEEDEEGRWSPGEMEEQGKALAQLFGHLKARIKSSSLDENSGLLSAKGAPPPVNLFGSLSRAILPFARSVILMMRSCAFAIDSRKRRKGSQLSESSPEAKILELVLDGSETLSTNDGMFILKGMQGPMPSLLVDESSSWWALINRWTTAVIVQEGHHGSRGHSILPSLSVPTGTENSASSGDDKGSREASRIPGEKNQHEFAAGVTSSLQALSSDDEDVMVEDEPMANTEGGAMGFAADHHLGESDEELTEDMEMDEAEELVEFANQVMGNALPGFSGGPRAPGSNGEDSADERSSSGSEDGDGNDASYMFAGVSQSPLISYQPSLLAVQPIGPGRQGSMFEATAASAVMADLSHLGMIHRKDAPTFSLIRLPKSFVELYGIVNKVKGRDDATLEDSEDVGNAETAICLLTGAVMRSGSTRRPFHRAQRPSGACTIHARKNGSGIGIFFLVQKCTVLLMHNNKSAYSASLYVDEHGEEDPGLRRGRPLFLNDARYRALELLWRQQGIPREVAQIRSTSDRVIRDNWY
eukprot:scaffold3084_cov144-Cylindrotheca_fusiformis.AAC.42